MVYALENTSGKLENNLVSIENLRISRILTWILRQVGEVWKFDENKRNCGN